MATIFDKVVNDVFTNLRRPYKPGDGKIYVYDASKFVAPSRVKLIGGIGGFRTQVNYSILALTGVDTSNPAAHFLIVGGAVENTTDVVVPQGSTVVQASTAGQYTALTTAINAIETNGGNGQPGAQGPPGPTGATGAKGDTGAQGPPGATGAKGDTGAQGPPGVQGPAGTGSGGGAPGGSSSQIQYNNSGAFAGSTNLSTVADTPLSITYDNGVYQTTSQQHAAINVENPNNNAQSQIQFTHQNAPTGKIRNDYVGGMSYVAYQNGGHAFVAGGDVGQGSSQVIASIDSTGLNVGNGSLSVASGNITSSGTELSLSQTGDSFGLTKLELLNRGGANGARFSCSLWLVDFIFYSIQNNIQSNIRFNTDSSNLPQNTQQKGGQFSFYMNTAVSGITAAEVGAGACRFHSPTTFVADASAGTPLTLTATSNQSVDLQQNTDSNGNILSGTDQNGYLRSVVGSGPPTSSPVDGSMYVDNANGFFYVRIAGVWKKAPLS